MAEINLGDFPYYGGVLVDDASMYIGNNRFLRIVSQRDNDATIAVLYETTDVFDDNATITQVCSEVINENYAATGHQLQKLDDGRIAVIGNIYGQGSIFYTFTVEYDELNNTFISSDVINLGNGDLNSARATDFTTISYGNSVYVSATNDYEAHHLVKISYSDPIVTQTVNTYNNNVVFDPNFDTNSNQYLNIVDNKLYNLITTYSAGYVISLDLDSDTIDNNISTTRSYVVKMSDTKFVSIAFTSDEVLRYRIFNSLPSSYETTAGGIGSSFMPQVKSISINYNNNYGYLLEAYALDDQHLIIFEKGGYNERADENNIYVRIVKVVDDNYAFVSDNSNGAKGHLLTSSYNGYFNTMPIFYTGKLIHKISTQQFYIQTDRNSYEFFSIVV